MKTKRCINTRRFVGDLFATNQFGLTQTVKKNARKLSVAEFWNILNHRRSYVPHSGLSL